MCQTQHFLTLFPISLQAKRQRGPPNCHCISAVPAGFGRNIKVVDTYFKAHNMKINFHRIYNIILFDSLGPAVLFFLPQIVSCGAKKWKNLPPRCHQQNHCVLLGSSKNSSDFHSLQSCLCSEHQTADSVHTR